jgi:hypothetical protein
MLGEMLVSEPLLSFHPSWTHLGRSVIESDVQDQPESSLMCFLYQKFHVLHGSKDWINLSIITNVIPAIFSSVSRYDSSFELVFIPHVPHWRFINR